VIVPACCTIPSCSRWSFLDTYNLLCKLDRIFMSASVVMVDK
jgi:hypothetical protein